MKFLKLPLRIILAPLALGMMALVLLLALLLAVSAWLLGVLSSLLAAFALLVCVTGNVKNGCVVLLLALMISPCGIVKMAEWLWYGIDHLRGRLWRFVFN